MEGKMRLAATAWNRAYLAVGAAEQAVAEAREKLEKAELLEKEARDGLYKVEADFDAAALENYGRVVETKRIHIHGPESHATVVAVVPTTISPGDMLAFAGYNPSHYEIGIRTESGFMPITKGEDYMKFYSTYKVRERKNE